jgi:hypothetical protein
LVTEARRRRVLKALAAMAGTSQSRYHPPVAFREQESNYQLKQNKSDQLQDQLTTESLQEDFVAFTSEVSLEAELDEFEVNDMQTDEKRYILKTRNLNMRMPAEKNQLQFWLELLDAQNLAKESLFMGKEKLIVEKKLSILDKAFESPALQSNLYLKLLRIDLLRMHEKSEDQYRLITREFNRMLDELPDPDGQVMALYLEFKHSYFINFSASLLRKNCGEILGAFKEMLEGATSTAEIKQFELLMHTVTVFGTLIESRMGYSEKAFGLLMALAEVNILHSTSLETIADRWEDHAQEKIGEVDPGSQVHVSVFEGQLLSCLGMDTLEFREQFFDKRPQSLEAFAEKEATYAKLHWRPANSRLDKVVTDHPATHRVRRLLSGAIRRHRRLHGTGLRHGLQVQASRLHTRPLGGRPPAAIRPVAPQPQPSSAGPRLALHRQPDVQRLRKVSPQPAPVQLRCLLVESHREGSLRGSHLKARICEELSGKTPRSLPSVYDPSLLLVCRKDGPI